MTSGNDCRFLLIDLGTDCDEMRSADALFVRSVTRAPSVRKSSDLDVIDVSRNFIDAKNVALIPHSELLL